MKICPWCRNEFDFITFMTRCGSDTLVSHSSKSHPREHLCGHCHKKFWISYHPRRFTRLVRQYMSAGFAAGLVFGVAFLQFFMGWPSGKALLTGMTFFFFSLPAAVSYARYQSADLNQEK